MADAGMRDRVIQELAGKVFYIYDCVNNRYGCVNNQVESGFIAKLFIRDTDRLKTSINSTALRSLLVLASLVVILAGIKAASQIVVPFLLALFLAIVLYPIVRYLAKHRVPPAVSIVLIMTVIVIALLMVSSILGTALNDFARSLPEYRLAAINKIRILQQYAETFNITISTEELLAYLDPAALVNFITRLLSSFSGMMTSIFLLLMTIVFMLFEVQTLPNKLRKIMHDPDQGMIHIQNAINGITRYVAIKTVVSMVTGFIVWAFLAMIGIKFAVLWGTLAFLLNYIPNIGSIIAAVLPIIQTLLFNSIPDALAVTAGYIIINLLLGNIIEPRIMGKGLGLSTLVVFLSLIFWGWLLGPIGMVLSVPLTVVVKIALETSRHGTKLAIILGDGK